jgi:hypothetical protein
VFLLLEEKVGVLKEGVSSEGGAVVGNANARSFRLTGVSKSRL